MNSSISKSKILDKKILDKKKQDLNPFKWDGTSIGVITEDQILNKYVLGSLEYWDIRKDIYQTICIVRKCKDFTPCIIDELKPLFGLIKLGTHYCKYESNYIILIRSRMDIHGKNIAKEIFLSDYTTKLDENLINRIKNIYIFRDILCLGKSNDSSIILRRNMTDNDIYPISFIDTPIKLAKLIDIKLSTVIPEVTFKKWLKDDSPSKILCKMFKINNMNKVVIKLYNAKSGINKLLMRISDSQHINLSDIIISRISNKLQFHLEKSNIKDIKINDVDNR